MADFMMGTPSRFEKIDKFGPQQTQGFEQILQQALGSLKGGPGEFGPIAQDAMRRYSQDIVPSLAERFSMTGSQGSSGFREALGRSGQDLVSRLAGMQSQHGLQRESNLLDMLRVGLTPQKEIGYFQGRQGAVGSILPGLAEGAGKLIEPLGKAVGGMASSGAKSFWKWLSKKFGKKIAPAIGSAAGTALGGSVGGPIGGAVGGVAGSAAMKALSYLIATLGKSKKQSGSVSFDPSQDPVLGSNVI